jgi:hypothetical protein
MFHKIGSRTVEIYYMNQKDCNNYNGYHGYRETDSECVREGYYYDSMIGPFYTEKEAIHHARQNYRTL